MEVPEVILDAEQNPIDEELLVNGVKEAKIKNVVKKKGSKTVINGLKFKNVAVIYRDELGKICRERIDVEVPEVEKDWYQPAVRKALHLWFDEQNIVHTGLIQVSLPSSAEHIELETEIFDKPIGEFEKKDIVQAAIYHRCRTVASALGYSAEEMRESLFLHLQNLEHLGQERFIDGKSQWDEAPYDDNYKVQK